jgi:diacylglycerol kinase (ATP)
MQTSQLRREPVAAPTVLLANRFAGRVKRATIARVVERLGLDGNAILETGTGGNARALAAQLVRDGVPRVLVAGGDGTWHQVIQVLAGTSTALGVVPLGTSNDLAARLRIPQDLDRALDVLADARIARIDLLNLNRHLVATVAGVGVAAQVAAACNRLRSDTPFRGPARALGRAIYSVTAACRIIRHGAQPTPCITRADGGAPVTHPVSTLLVGTVPRFGGGLRLAADDELSDGTFCALVVTATTRAALLRTLLQLKAGRPCRHGRCYPRLSAFALRSRTLLGAFGDGEWLGPCHRVAVSVERAALCALVPALRREPS